tara:strand:+ start:200 stop:427 length:228 start_codon:yes stop_codon:yes gene_type:complete
MGIVANRPTGSADHTDGTAHQWSGWPGAFCLLCRQEDPVEQCLGGCTCECHIKFWQDAEEDLKRLAAKEGERECF